MRRTRTGDFRSRFQPKLERLEDRRVPTNLPPGFSETTVTTGLQDNGCLTFAPDGRAFICQLRGDVRVVDQAGNLLPEPFLHVEPDFQGEHGLLGLAFDPNFSQNGYVYVSYSVRATPVFQRVSRFTTDPNNPNKALPDSEVVILETEPVTTIIHVGGDIEFGADGKLYISVGDAGVAQNSQAFDNLLGKMLRINSDGTIPPDNPFVNQPEVRPEIFAFGFRNPFRFDIQPKTGLVFVNDVGSDGPTAREEVNRLYSGGNYGWPKYEGYTNDPDYNGPEYAYPHGTDPETGSYNCSVTGGAFYGPGVRQFPREYITDYFFMDLCGQWIRRYDQKTQTVSLFASDTDILPIDLAVSPTGSLYYLALYGNLHRIDYSPPPIPPARTLSALDAQAVRIVMTPSELAPGYPMSGSAHATSSHLNETPEMVSPATARSPSHPPRRLAVKHPGPSIELFHDSVDRLVY